MNPHRPGALALSRRDVAKFALIGATIAQCPGTAALARRPAAPVVGFHADAPWLDPSGHDRPYAPPAGLGRDMPDSERLMRLGHFL